MHNEVLSILDRFWNVRIGVQPPGVGEEGFVVMDLLVKGNPGISPEIQECSSWRTVFTGHEVLQLEAGRGGAGLQQSLQVDAPFSLQLELEVVFEALISCQLAQGFGNAGQYGQVIFTVEDGRNASLPDLKEGIGTAGGHFQILKLHPGIGGQSQIRILDGSRHLDIQ